MDFVSRLIMSIVTTQWRRQIVNEVFFPDTKRMSIRCWQASLSVRHWGRTYTDSRIEPRSCFHHLLGVIVFAEVLGFHRSIDFALFIMYLLVSYQFLSLQWNSHSTRVGANFSANVSFKSTCASLLMRYWIQALENPFRCCIETIIVLLKCWLSSWMKEFTLPSGYKL